MRFWVIIVSIFLINSCRLIDQKVEVSVESQPFEKLSDYHFFKGPLDQLIPNERVIPYDLITPLFSDYASKERFLWIPEASSASIGNDGTIDFPDGTALIKNFYYEAIGDASDRILETRLLIKRGTTWDPLTYIWNEDQTEAQLEIAGDFREITAHDTEGQQFTIDYAIPNKNQCKSCHEKNRQVVPLGPTLKNLNRTYEYVDGMQNQLVRWSDLQFLTGYDSSMHTEQLADWADPEAPLHDRALAYLEVNCGSCHRDQGPANVSGLRLTSDEKNPFNLGVNKPPVSAGKGSGGRLYDIVPGKPDESILVYRMESLEPGAMMPEMGRKLVHKEGVKLIRDWIQEME